MTPIQLLKLYGGDKTRAAAAIGYTYAAVLHWEKKNRIPYRAQVLIQNATHGELVAVKTKKG